jgi:predicted nucleotidyltransferase
MSIEAYGVEKLQELHGTQWLFFAAARARAEGQLEELDAVCAPIIPPDTSLVVFGSLARKEFTEASDVDWTLLVDGITIPEHSTVARRLEEKLKELHLAPPGQTGTFGNIAASHNLIHFIGGEDDTNANTTRRSLLLLEAKPIGDSAAFNRVRNNILKRFLDEDLGLWRRSTKIKIPHFLLNDFARYWRTMTVDFADKQHDRFHEGFALRNIKLRFSRKLMYISGLIACLRCQLDYPEIEERLDFFSRDNSVAVTDLVRSFLDKAPLDSVADALRLHVGKPASIKTLFESYDGFLGILSNVDKRTRLKTLTPKDFESDSVYKDAREMSHAFGRAVEEIFLTADNPVGELTIKYGVF